MDAECEFQFCIGGKCIDLGDTLVGVYTISNEIDLVQIQLYKVIDGILFIFGSLLVNLFKLERVIHFLYVFGWSISVVTDL